MLKNITLGQYFPGDTFIHRLDSRTKLLATVALIVAVFLAQGVLSYALLFAFVLACIKLSNVGMKFIWKGLKPILFIVVITFVLNIFFTPGEVMLLEWKFIHISQNGLITAARMALRLVLLVMSTQILTLTTSPISLTDGMERLLKPLARIGFPAHELAMMMSIALRFIPTLLEETDKIMKAQKSRGADFESGNLIQRAKAMLPLLVPLFLSAFRRADELALAMEARCYRGGNGRTRMKQMHYGRGDAIAGLSLSALIAAVVLLNKVF
ncbi:MAG: energy-coupling factor transporter transmembrane protein EcfT [Eubacteriales bacterium]|nr:energy-coupling factor transporter transmembrane protein EcfT [Eubacteriales bacterium]